MKQEIDQIKQGIEQCKSTGEMMPMPNFNGEGFSVKEFRLKPTGTILYRRRYKVNYDNGDWIQIEYSSKCSNSKTAASPRYSEVKVTCSDSSQNFTDGWDENA